MTRTPADQTRGELAPLPNGTTPLRLSQSEVVALCTKAARGAGMSWGMAEEAGMVAAWLTARGIDGPRYLLAHLQAAQGKNWPDLRPIIAPGAWAAAGQAMCPIALGTALSDHAALPNGLISEPIRLGPVGHPVLLCAFLSGIADSMGGIVTLEWAGGRADIGGLNAPLPDRVSALDGRSLRLTFTKMSAVAKAAHLPAPTPALAIDAATITALGALALRTTVPASAASRAGAGAGTSDND